MKPSFFCCLIFYYLHGKFLYPEDGDSHCYDNLKSESVRGIRSIKGSFPRVVSRSDGMIEKRK
jgi:hypothetical protein